MRQSQLSSNMLKIKERINSTARLKRLLLIYSRTEETEFYAAALQIKSFIPGKAAQPCGLLNNSRSVAGIVNGDLGLPFSGLLKDGIFIDLDMIAVLYYLFSAHDYGIDIGRHSRINDMRVNIIDGA